MRPCSIPAVHDRDRDCRPSPASPVTDSNRSPRLLTALAIDPSDWRSEAGRILRYGLVGGLTAVVYFTVTIAGVEWIGFAPVVASLVAQAATVGLAFYGHALY